MQRKRHWTVYAIIAVGFFTVIAFVYEWQLSRLIMNFEAAVNEAGGAVHYNHGTVIPLPKVIDETKFYISDAQPVSVEISSGSHPIPNLLPLNRMPTIKGLVLNTSDVGDHHVPMITKLRHIETLDISDSEMSVQAILQLLESLPQLNELKPGSHRFTPQEISKLKAAPRAAILKF